MKNSLFTLFRPASVEEEQANEKQAIFNEKAEETKSMNDDLLKTDFTANYTQQTFSHLNSDVFTNPGENVKIADPKSYEEAEMITQAIEAGKAVMLFLDGLDESERTRVLDFVSGYCHAYSIQPQETKENYLWLIDPQHKKIQSRF